VETRIPHPSFHSFKHPKFVVLTKDAEYCVAAAVAGCSRRRLGSIVAILRPLPPPGSGTGVGLPPLGPSSSTSDGFVRSCWVQARAIWMENVYRKNAENLEDYYLPATADSDAYDAPSTLSV